MRVTALLLLAATLGLAQVRIYVANDGDGNVTVIDPATNKVTGEIAVSPNPYGITASPEGHWLYVTSRTKALLDAVDLKTGKRTRGAATGRDPSDLAVAPDTRHVFVCTAPSLDVIDTASLERVKSIFEIKGPCRIETTPDDTRMIVAPAADSMLHIINIRSMTPEFSIAAGAGVRAIAIEGDRNHVIHRIFAAIPGEVEVIDYASRKMSGRIPVAARDLAVSPDWRTLWATVGDSVEVFFPTDLKRVATIPLGKGAGGIAFTPDGKRCFVANADDNSVSAIDAATYHELARIPVGKGPGRIVASEWMR
jgi:YVTN family beta-propeller protein